jgi:hypothetical protein
MKKPTSERSESPPLLVFVRQHDGRIATWLCAAIILGDYPEFLPVPGAVDGN